MNILDLEKASKTLFHAPSEDSLAYILDEWNLRSFGTEWKEAQFNLEEFEDPYLGQSKHTEIKLKYGHEGEMLIEVLIEPKLNLRG